MAEFDDAGREIPDPTPVEIPVSLALPETADQVALRLAAKLMSHWAVQNDHETFEQALDFDIDDDFEDMLDSETKYQEMVEDFDILAEGFPEGVQREQEQQTAQQTPESTPQDQRSEPSES